MPRRLLFAAAAALIALTSAAAQVEAFKPSGPVSPAGARATCDIPPSLHIRNTGGSDGAGLCVFTSFQLECFWQNVPGFEGFQKWMTRRPGGGYPTKLDAMVRQYCAEKGLAVPQYVQHTGGDESFLELAIATGRMPCITYAGRDDFYRGMIYHMVNLAAFTPTEAAIIDNNRPGVWVWMTRAELLKRWRDANGGWAVCLLAPPPPPHPEAVTVFGQCGPEGCTPPPRRSPAPTAPAPAAKAGPSPAGTAPGPDFVWHNLPGVGWGWVQKSIVAPKAEQAPVADNFGIDAAKVHDGKRWTLNGRECSRDDVFKAMLTDDSDRYHLVAVGHPTFRGTVAAALARLPAEDRGRILFNGYDPEHWAVKLFELQPGITLRKPARNRVGADAGHSAAAADLAGLVEAAFRPRPAPDPTPEPQPDPAPGPGRFPYGPAIAAALVVLFLVSRRFQK